MNETRLGLYINIAKATHNDIMLLQDYIYVHSTLLASTHCPNPTYSALNNSFQSPFFFSACCPRLPSSTLAAALVSTLNSGFFL